MKKEVHENTKAAGIAEGDSVQVNTAFKDHESDEHRQKIQSDPILADPLETRMPSVAPIPPNGVIDYTAHNITVRQTPDTAEEERLLGIRALLPDEDGSLEGLGADSESS